MTARATHDALRAHPDDVELRAVYADALLERGGDDARRGELIQLEHLATRDPAAERRATELRTWLKTHYRAQRIEGLRFDRGFVVAWEARADNIAAHAELLFAAEPRLDDLRILLPGKTTPKTTRAIANLPELALVHRLALVGNRSITGRLGVTGLAVILEAEAWSPGLAALALPSCALANAGAELLAASPIVASLRELDLANNDIGAAGTIALAASPHLANLRALVLRGNKPGVRGVAALAASPTLTALARLDLSMAYLSRAMLAPVDARFPGAVVHHDRLDTDA